MRSPSTGVLAALPRLRMLQPLAANVEPAQRPVNLRLVHQAADPRATDAEIVWAAGLELLEGLDYPLEAVRQVGRRARHHQVEAHTAFPAH